MEGLLKTKHEIKKEAQNRKICETFKSLRNEFPSASASKIFKAVAFKCDVTDIWAREICIKHGLYQVRRKKA